MNAADLATARTLAAEAVAEITGTPPVATVADLHRVLADFLDRTGIDAFDSKVESSRTITVHVKFDGDAIPTALDLAAKINATHVTFAAIDDGPYFHIHVFGAIQGHKAVLNVLADGDERDMLRREFAKVKPYTRVELDELRALAAGAA